MVSLRVFVSAVKVSQTDSFIKNLGRGTTNVLNTINFIAYITCMWLLFDYHNMYVLLMF